MLGKDRCGEKNSILIRLICEHRSQTQQKCILRI